MLQKSINFRYLNHDGRIVVVNSQAKVVFQCERGFWWYKERKPEIVNWGNKQEWTEHKSLLHGRANGVLKPYWSEPVSNWKSRVYYTTEKEPVKIDIDCSEF